MINARNRAKLADTLSALVVEPTEAQAKNTAEQIYSIIADVVADQLAERERKQA